jgi:hypothetical protein
MVVSLGRRQTTVGLGFKGRCTTIVRALSIYMVMIEGRLRIMTVAGVEVVPVDRVGSGG